MKFLLSFFFLIVLSLLVAQTDTNVVLIAEVMPEFPGGEKELFKYLGDCYPVTEPAQVNCPILHHTVYITWIIKTDGSVSEVEALRADDCSIYKAYVQCIENMPLWSPALQDGKAVACRYSIPLRNNFR